MLRSKLALAVVTLAKVNGSRSSGKAAEKREPYLGSARRVGRNLSPSRRPSSMGWSPNVGTSACFSRVFISGLFQFAGGSQTDGAAVSEGEFLFMARGARLFPVDGHAGVVEEIPAEFDFGGRHRVVGRDVGLRESFGEIPLVVSRHRGDRSGQQENGDDSLTA